MYTESEKREINWGVIVKRAIIAIGIIILVLLLIWMISKINGTNDNNKATYDNQSTTKVENKSLETYSKKFIDNIRYMQDVARNYWLINGTLPTDGNSIEFTLKELISKGLILPFSDKYGNACDLNESYVSLTNNNETYTMSVKLACDTETATISEELGCNQFCDGKCTDVDTKIQYQFKQAYEATTTTYTCPSGYKRNGNKCYKGSNVVIDATKNSNYYCPTGYKKDGNKCITNDKIIDATALTKYSCPSGYTLSGTNCYKSTSNYIAATAKTTYSCPSGYTKSGSSCTKTTTSTKDLTTTTTYTCPSGYTKSGSGTSTKCYKYTTNEGKKYLTTYQNLGSSCTYLGRKAKDNCTTNCNKLYYTYYCTEKVKVYADYKKTTTTSCPSGYTKSSGKCVKTTTSTISATSNTTYSCPSDYNLSGNKCYTSGTTSTKASLVVYNYSCPTGYKNIGTKCMISGDSIDLKVSYTYSCPSGYTKSGSGASSKCYKNNSEVMNATAKTSKVTKYKYTWSDSTTLAGWIATGKTRTVSSK